MSSEKNGITPHELQLMIYNGIITASATWGIGAITVTLGLLGHFVWNLGWFPIVVIILAWLASLVGVVLIIRHLIIVGLVAVFSSILVGIQNLGKQEKGK